jgi:hypothetical protein
VPANPVPIVPADGRKRLFTDSVTSDLDAVTRGLTTRWNSGPIEGRVNHATCSNGSMFGSARLPLLRKRVCARRQLLRAYRPKPPTYERRRRHVRAPPPSAQVRVR